MMARANAIRFFCPPESSAGKLIFFLGKSNPGKGLRNLLVCAPFYPACCAGPEKNPGFHGQSSNQTKRPTETDIQ